MEGFEGFCKAKFFHLSAVAGDTESYSSSDVLVVLDPSLRPPHAFPHKHTPCVGGIHQPNCSRVNIAALLWNWNPVKQLCQDTLGPELTFPFENE